MNKMNQKTKLKIFHKALHLKQCPDKPQMKIIQSVQSKRV